MWHKVFYKKIWFSKFYKYIVLTISNRYLVTEQPVVVKLLWQQSQCSSFNLCCYFFTGISELSNGSKWIRSNVSYYGAMRAGQSHQTLYFDGCGHTDSHNHTYMSPTSPFLPLLPHTSLDSKAHKHTSWPGGQWGRKSIFEELELPGLVVEIRFLL